VAQPDLAISVRQFGWSGETASGFLARMTNDCLRFQPTVATTCYGMNDHGYRVYEDAIGQKYREMSTAIVEAFKTNGARVIQGSPGCVGKTPSWSKDTNAATEALNLNLCELRNIGIDIAQHEQIGFADVFWPMLMSGYAAQEKYGTNYAIAGGDGVHPDWAGHLVMAYAFLRSFGLNGDIGTFTIDLKADKAKASAGHEVLSFSKGALQIKSTRYPFCAKGDPKKHNSIRSGMTLVPFNQELNRLTLVVKNAKEKSYVVAWGTETKIYSAEQLAKGVNLADDFPENPFSEAFKKVNDAVKAKQEYETKQIKQLFHGEEGKNDMEATAAKTEKEREPLVAAIKKAFVPVTHVIRIEAN
jgi:lysophospholipase L1-like esterase